MKILGKKILIRKLEGGRKQGGLDIPKAEGDLPEAEVIAVSSELELEVSKVNIPKAGDIIYYSVPREAGRVYTEAGEELFIIDVGLAVAIK